MSAADPGPLRHRLFAPNRFHEGPSALALFVDPRYGWAIADAGR